MQGKDFFDMFIKHYWILLLISLIILIGGCKVRVQYPAEYPSETIINQEQVYWFWGFLGDAEFEVYNHCAQGRVYEVKIHSTTKQAVYTALTGGVYSPRTLTIVCSIRGEETN